MVAVYPFGYHEARQRTSSDLKLPPHIHAAFLDGAYRDKGDELDLRAVGHLSPRDVAAVLERTRDRMLKCLRRHGLLFVLEHVERFTIRPPTPDTVGSSSLQAIGYWPLSFRTFWGEPWKAFAEARPPRS